MHRYETLMKMMIQYMMKTLFYASKICSLRR